MIRRQDYVKTLAFVVPHGREAIRTYLTEQSGLPGPRGNIELAQAWGDVGPETVVREFAADSDEYLRFCGVIGVGRLAVEAIAGARRDASAMARVTESFTQLRRHAADPSWRVREAVAMALQRVGDHEPEVLRAVVAQWAQDQHPLVQRAAIAGVCEPRLLYDAATAAVAISVCETTTARLVARPPQERRLPDVRTLRQALGYCWSVAIAADPDRGLPVFEQVERTWPNDVDVAWIVRENGRKDRLKRVLDERR